MHEFQVFKKAKRLLRQAMCDLTLDGKAHAQWWGEIAKRKPALGMKKLYFLHLWILSICAEL